MDLHEAQRSLIDAEKKLSEACCTLHLVHTEDGALSPASHAVIVEADELIEEARQKVADAVERVSADIHAP